MPALTLDTNSEDYWLQQHSRLKSPSVPQLKIETIEEVEPLDTQLGVAVPKTVPNELYGALFGQPEPKEIERSEVAGEHETVRPVHTYAILDAAKAPGLPELLAASELEHRCLFKGDAYEELKDVAPWIVCLDEGSSMTRNLFTRSDAGWHMWDRQPGIYVRSLGTLDDMWSHFRKFTKVQDENGTWFYWRFWQAEYLAPILQAADPAMCRRFFMDGKVKSLHAIPDGTRMVSLSL